MSTKAKREKRFKLVQDAQAIIAKDVVTAEDQTRFDAMMAEADKLKVEIDSQERAEAALQDLNESRGRQSGRELDTPSAEQRNAAYKDAFWTYARHGIDALEPEQRKLLRGGFQTGPELRAPQSSTTTAGGYTIPEGFQAELEKALLEFGGIRKLARVLRTPTGQALPWPTVNDTSNKATRVSENTQSSETAVTFGVKQLDAYTYRSMILAPIELLMDAAFDLNAFFIEQLAERVARGTNYDFTLADGSSKPQGIVPAAAAGRTADSSSSISYDDLVELQHSVDPAYRVRGAFMLSDNALKIIKKLKDGENRPLWVPGLAVREPDTILGHRYEVNQDMASVEASAKSVLFGDFSKFLVRDVSSMITMRLTERYADYGQVGFIVFSRHDSELINAGTNPIKYLIHPSP